jgi:hypothetical protein
MRVKLAWLVRVGAARPLPFITFTITSKDAVYAPGEWADTYTNPVSSQIKYVLCGVYTTVKKGKRFSRPQPGYY